MKGILLLVLISSMLFSACSQIEEKAQGEMDFGFSKAIGLTEQEVYDKLKISADFLEESNMTGRYDMKKTTIFNDMEFSEYLLFWKPDSSENILYGGGYEYITQNDSELAKKISLIISELQEQFGESVTYPGSSNRIEDNTDFSQYTMKELKERWNGHEDKSTVTLKVIFVGEDVRVQIEYVVGAKF